MTPLEELLEKVENGGDVYDFGAVGGPLLRGQAESAYRGSLDAAKALHEALLPDLGWEVYERSRYPNMIPSALPHRYVAEVGWGETIKAGCNNPARAWLICILKALTSQQQTKEDG